MRSSLQITPASSSWLQSLFPQPRDLQSTMLFSLPPQFTLSSQTRPAEAPSQGGVMGRAGARLEGVYIRCGGVFGAYVAVWGRSMQLKKKSEET